MSGYYDNVRMDLIPFLPQGRGLRVLELGCGEGRTGAYLKSTGLASEVVGVEFDPMSAELARTRLDEVFVGDLDVFDAFPGEFDLILAADVIEHLKDPWASAARFLNHLKPGGWLVTSTPNIRYWRILWDLGVKGQWQYADSGILDRTHLRFFTRESITAFHRGLGMDVEAIGHPELSGKRAILNRVMRGTPEDLLIGQHVVRSRKSA